MRREGAAPDEFLLTRFLVSCCVADAPSVQVRLVRAPPALPEDRWVEVTGTIYPLGREVIVQASRVRPVPRPSDPYLQV